MKEGVKKLEVKIGDLLKDTPDLPKSSKETLVNVWPWIALIFGVLQLIAAWSLLGVLQWSDSVVNTLASYYQPILYSPTERFFIYLGIVMLVVDAVILLMAYPELAKRRRRGWDLLFLGALINMAYAVTSVFIHGRGISSLILGIVSTGIAFYLLFQVKDMYSSKSTPKPETKTK